MKPIDLTNPNARKSPFKVPEGYFENFTEQMMSRLPEASGAGNDAAKARPVLMVSTNGTVKATATPQEAQPAPRVTLFDRVKPYLYLAATIGGLAFGVHVFQYQQRLTVHKDATVATLTTEQANAYVDDVFDYAMIDDHDVFACATDNF